MSSSSSSMAWAVAVARSPAVTCLVSFLRSRLILILILMVSQQLAKPLYDAKIMPSTLLPKLVGNMYTASLYATFASIVHNKHTTLVGQRVLMFSYGSGLASTMFSFKIRERELPFTVSNITEVMDIQSKIDSRQEFLPEDFVENLKRMETLYGAKDFVSTSQQSFLQPGAFYLTKVDSMYR